MKVNFGDYHIIRTAIVMAAAAAAVLGIFAIVILPQAYATDDTCNSNTNDNVANCTHQRHGSPKDATPFVLPFP
jgi:hypothetical protein